MITPKEPLRKALLFWNIFVGEICSFYPSEKDQNLLLFYDKLHITLNQNTHRTDCF